MIVLSGSTDVGVAPVGVVGGEALGQGPVLAVADDRVDRRAVLDRDQLRVEGIGGGILAAGRYGYLSGLIVAGVDIDPELGTGKHISMLLAQRGVLVKDTHGSTLRFAPPLVITDEEIDWAVDQFTAALDEARVENMRATS